MARGKNQGFRFSQAYAKISEGVNNYSISVAREIAIRLVKKAAEVSPYYSGEFADNWVVIAGNSPIPNDTSPTEPRPKNRQKRQPPVLPEVPSLYGKKTLEYTIGNTMEYRDIAMDLVPGRVEEGHELSAPPDWYRIYLARDVPKIIKRILDNPGDLEDYIRPGRGPGRNGPLRGRR